MCVCRSNIDDNIKTQANEKMNGANEKRKQPASNKIEIGLKYRIKCCWINIIQLEKNSTTHTHSLFSYVKCKQSKMNNDNNH